MGYPCVYYERQEDGLLGRCKYSSKDGVQSWCTEGMDDCEHETPSNADRIRAMTDEEMATELLPLFEELCEDGIPSPEYMRFWLKLRFWLKQPAKEDE